MPRLVPLLLLLPLAACTPGKASDEGDTDARSDTDALADTDVTADTDSAADTDASPRCAAPANLGSWFGALLPEKVAAEAPAVDAGLSAVLAATPGPDAVSLAITNAVVSNLPYDNPSLDVSELWISDVSGAVHVISADSGAESIPFGNQISLTVTRIESLHGTRTVTATTGVSLAGSLLPVLVLDRTDSVLDPIGDMNKNVMTWGEITSDDGDCGTKSRCFTLTTGHGDTARFRVPTSRPIAVGDCVEAVAPLTTYDGTPQLDIVNPDWIEVY